MALPEAHDTQRNSVGWHDPVAEPSVSSSLEHLVAGSQGVITKRIDLALLEGQELLSRSLQRGAMVAFATVLAAGAWFAAAACVVLVVAPNASLALHLAAFALLNAAGAFGLVALAMRGRPLTPARPPQSSTTAEP